MCFLVQINLGNDYNPKYSKHHFNLSLLVSSQMVFKIN